MTKTLVICSVLAFALGCAKQVDLITEENKLNQATTERVAKAKNLDDIKKTLLEHRAQKKVLSQKAHALRAEQQRDLMKRFIEGTMASRILLQEAIAEFCQRAESKANPRVRLDTSLGPIDIELYEKLAPVTVKNFLTYVDDKFYDDTIFHRVIPSFMIQGGGFAPGMKREKPTRPPIENESFNGLTNESGTVAMARTGEPDSATAQFFINVVDNHALNMLEARDGVGYAVFGKVTAGMDVVNRIRQVKTTTVAGHENVPVDDVIIKSIRRVERN